MRSAPKQAKTVTHLSHSARELLERCAKSYWLKYFTDAPRSQSLWLAGGSAVHETTEHYDLMRSVGNADIFRAEDVWDVFFDRQLEELRSKEPNEHKWRRSASEGDIDAWRRAGLSFVQSYIDWRERSPWEIWTTPDGEPAIELDISGRLPGCPVEIKAYLDRIMYDPVFKKHWIVDLKTSKKPPQSAAQFEVYAALVKVKYGLRVSDGAAFMNRRATLSKPFDLSEVTPEGVGAVFGEAWKQVQSGEFPATGIANGACFICDTSSSCHARGGPLASMYDPDSPGYPPPF